MSIGVTMACFMDSGTTADDGDVLIMSARIGDSINRETTAVGQVRMAWQQKSTLSYLHLSSTQLRSVLEEQSRLAIHHQPAALTFRVF